MGKSGCRRCRPAFWGAATCVTCGEHVGRASCQRCTPSSSHVQAAGDAAGECVVEEAGGGGIHQIDPPVQRGGKPNCSRPGSSTGERAVVEEEPLRHGCGAVRLVVQHSTLAGCLPACHPLRQGKASLGTLTNDADSHHQGGVVAINGHLRSRQAGRAGRAGARQISAVASQQLPILRWPRLPACLPACLLPASEEAHP